MSKQVLNGEDSREKLIKGINTITDSVKVTLGAKGRNVMIQREFSFPHITKDGVTVARSISLKDPVEDMGAQLIREVAGKAVTEAGDGTTTASVLAQAIVNEGMKFVRDGVNPMDIKKGIDKAVENVEKELEKLAQPIKDDFEKIKQVATLSANGDEELGTMIAEAFEAATIDGVVEVKESKSDKTFPSITDGYEFVNGLESPAFVTNPEKLTAEYENCLILLYGGKIEKVVDILPAINRAAQMNLPLLIIANGYDGEVITTLAKNKIKNGFRIAAVKSPSYGENRMNMLDDLAVVTGGSVFAEEKGFTIQQALSETEDGEVLFNPKYFGGAANVIISRDKTTIIEGFSAKENIENRIEELKKQVDEMSEEFDDKLVKDRIAKLKGKACVIYVGGATEVEVKEKLDRVDDALSATKAAVEEGIVAGGGIALKSIAEKMMIPENNLSKGEMVLYQSLSSPFNQILKNAGVKLDMDSLILLLDSYPFGFDVRKEEVVDMIQEGIVDPKKVTRIALRSAASIASLILTTESTVVEEK